MAIEYLKRGKPADERAADDQKVAAVVADALQEIDTRGDVAVRELSKKFDKHEPQSFRLSVTEIEALMSRVASRDMEDIRFAQLQI